MPLRTHSAPTGPGIMPSSCRTVTRSPPYASTPTAVVGVPCATDSAGMPYPYRRWASTVAVSEQRPLREGDADAATVFGLLVAVRPGRAFVLAEDPSAAAEAEVAEAREVRTTSTSEMGVPHPAGVTYVPEREELLVAAPSGASTHVVRLGTDENALGELQLPALSDTSTLAYDAAADQLSAVTGDELVVAPGSAITTSRPPVQRTDIGDLALDDPTGATFDAASGTWFVLDAGTPAIVTVSDRGTDPGAPERLPLSQLAGRDLQGIAFNPSDQLVYVGSPDEAQVYGLDTSGQRGEDVQRGRDRSS